MIVLDASAAVEWLLRTSTGLRLDRRLFDERESLHAPHLVDLEVTQVLRRYVRERLMPEHRAAQALGDLADLPLTRYPHDPLVPRIWDLRNNLTAYDAAYVGLAEALDATLVTSDRRLRDSRVHDARVELFG